MSEFIFMLTRDDVTVPDAVQLLDQLEHSALKYVGFKDVGADEATMRTLVKSIQSAGRVAVLEVVSLSEADELRSAAVALDLGVDYLVGGTRWQPVKELLAGSDIRYFPYVGEIVGHPAELRGSREQIRAEALAVHGEVDGINLLAYRHRTDDGLALAEDINTHVDLPVLCAGSVNSLQRVEALAGIDVWGFTIGAALLDGTIVPHASLPERVDAVLKAARAAH